MAIKSIFNYILGDGGIVLPPDPVADVYSLKFKVLNVGTPEITTADFKYNKDVAFMTGFDDSLVNQLQLALQVFCGGYSPVSGITYPGLSYDDGTGKTIYFRGTLVSISDIIKESNSGNINIYSWPMVRDAIGKRWGVSNHTAYHGGGPFPWDNLKNVKLAEQEYFDNTGYRIMVGTTPASDEGYMYTFKNLGYLAHSSTFNEGNAAITIYNNCSPEQVPTGFFNLDREYFGDGFTDDELPNFFSYIDGIFSKSRNGNKHMGNWLTHGPGDPANFLDVYSYILNHPENTNQNRVWFPSVPEFLEYFNVKRNTGITYSISGDELTINIDQSMINRNIRDRSLSLLLSGVTLLSLESNTGSAEVRFNNATGLINIDLVDGTKAANPNTDVLPAQITSLTKSGNNVLVTYDKAVTQSLAAGFKVSGKTVTGLIGSGTSWTVACDSSISSSDTLKYQSFNGDAVTVGTGLKVCDYINYPIS